MKFCSNCWILQAFFSLCKTDRKHSYLLLVMSIIWSFKKIISFFIWGCPGSLLLQAGFLQLRWVGAPLHCGAWFSLWWCLLLQSTGSRTWVSVVAACGLQSMGSMVVARGLSCCTAGGILLDQGSNPCPRHWQVDSQSLDYREVCIYELMHTDI